MVAVLDGLARSLTPHTGVLPRASCGPLQVAWIPCVQLTRVLVLPIFAPLVITVIVAEPVSPADAMILPEVSRQELVVFVGYPCLGKTSFYHKHFSPAGYAHVNQDTLSSRQMCVRAADEALKGGKSVVIGASHVVRAALSRRYRTGGQITPIEISRHASITLTSQRNMECPQGRCCL